MPQFTYTARNKEGQKVSNTVDAADHRAAGEALRAHGMLPTSIRAQKRGVLPKFNSLAAALARVSLLEKLTFAKNLSVTLKAGLPLARALAILAKQMPNPYFQKVVADVGQRVESGKALSESLAAYPKVFPPLFVNMVKVGETSGGLDETLEYLAGQISRDYNLLRRTRGAMMYPAVVLFALLAIGYLMFTFVLPKLTDSLQQFNTQLPVLTRVIIAVVNVFSQYSLVVLFVFLAAVAGFVAWHRTPAGRRAVHRLLLSLPLISTIIKKLNLARFTIIFGGLLKSGTPIVEALSVTARTMTNVYYEDAIADASEKVKIGVNLVAALERYPKLFTPMVTQMVSVGEESGTMEKVLEEVAVFYEAEVDDTVKNLSSIIEPVLVIVIGAVVGLLAVGLILPIYSITQNI